MPRTISSPVIPAHKSLTKGAFTGPVSAADVLQASKRIAPYIIRTPLIYSRALSQQTGAEVWLKLENLQNTGSFKIRGAANRILQLSAEERKRGIITVSSGNHGRAVARVAQETGIAATICLSTLVPENKVEAIRSYGANVHVAGNSQDEAQEEAERLIREKGLVWISAFDDLAIITGQGTIGLEIMQDMPDCEIIMAPLSGGGLLAGIALATKSISSYTRIIGVSMEIEPGMVRSLEAGKPVNVDEHPSLADALGGSIGLDNRYTFPYIRDYMDEAVLVSEASLAPALRYTFENEGLVIEGGSATVIAALCDGKIGDIKGKKIAVVLSGRNISTDKVIKALTD
ncbi:hydroxyectoine utilization dehydratase EutB [Kiloniella laminariae]|uniref:Hydroxyectoine utilization dehydratase EutB n=1 Tax=Kiloniella laminariae TaxID=454162 RepID=A0ABT4LNR0_9PROT|nr:hydroxyectoine utilization dehydratase EutB [Kiloniella laminariae]MCZ4282748.1 hydroxyectoine utilization dehydratase EutB [Kiloniella laminariae]